MKNMIKKINGWNWNEENSPARIKNMMFTYEMYLRSQYHSLWDAYEKPSMEKEQSYEECLRRIHDMGGRDVKVIGRSTFAYSLGFEFPHPETGELCFGYITKDNNRYAIVQ